MPSVSFNSYIGAHGILQRSRGMTKKIANNTRMFLDGREYGDPIVIKLHGNEIIRIHHGDIFELSSAGWRTVTTKERLNRFSPARVYSKKGDWYVWVNGTPIRFYDGIRVTKEGVPLLPYAGYQAEGRKAKVFKPNPRRKSKAGYCRERQTTPKKFDKRSFRVIRLGKGKKGIIGCPKGKWSKRRQRCKVGTRLQSILHPAGTKACPVGGKELRKRKRRYRKNTMVSIGKWRGYVAYHKTGDPHITNWRTGLKYTFKDAHKAIHNKLQELKKAKHVYWVEDYGVRRAKF